MDIEAVGNRHIRPLLRRVIGCQILLLVVLWHFDATSREAGAVWRPVNKISTYISSVPISKDVLILNHEEQNTITTGSRNDLIKFPLIYYAYSASCFSWPICRSAGAGIMSALGDDVIYGVLQIDINGKDSCIAITITTHTRTYGRSEPIVLKLVADHVIRLNYAGGGSGRLAVYDVGPQLEAIENGADIGAELALFGVFRDISLIPSGIGEAISRLDGVFSVNAGLSHLNQLVSDEEITPDGSATQYNGSNCQNSSPDDQRPRLPFVGISLIVVGIACAASGAVILCGNRRRAVLAGAGLLVVATLVVFHGIGFLLLPFNEWPIP